MGPPHTATVRGILIPVCRAGESMAFWIRGLACKLRPNAAFCHLEQCPCSCLFPHLHRMMGTMVWVHCVLLVWMMSLEKHSVLPPAETQEVT